MDGAFEQFNKAITKFPNESEPYLKRGVIYLIRGDMINAIADFNGALTIDKLENYYTYRGLAYLKIGKNNEVIKDLKKALKLDQRSFTAFAYLGVALVKNERYIEAIGALENAIQLHNNDKLTFYYLGLAYFNTQKWRKAENALTNAINLNIKDSDQTPIHALRGETRFYIKNFAGAIDDLKLALSISPNDSHLHQLLGKAQQEIR